MKTLFIRTVVIFLVCSISALFAAPVNISQSNISILEHSDVFIDSDEYTLEQIIREKKFTPYDQQFVRTGTKKQKVWMRFTLKNDTNRTSNKIILFGTPFVENIYFYDESNFSKSDLKGLAHVREDHETLLHYFSVSLPPHSVKHYYAMAYSEYTYLNFRVMLEDEAAYIQKDRTSQLIDIFLIGFIFALMIYSFVISIYIKDKSYFFYALYLIPLLLYQLKFVGLTQVYLSKELVELDLRMTIIRVYLLLITNALFAMHFLDIKRYKRLYRIFVVFIATSVIFMILFNTPDTIGLRLSSLLGLFLMVFNLMVGIYVYRQGYKQARLYITGFVIVFCSYIGLITDSMGLTSVLLYYPNILLWATSFEALVLSLAFADRYIILQKEKEQTYKLYLEESRNREREIAVEVEEKTRQLSTVIRTKEMLLQEVHHRVKNNLQMILSMLKLQAVDIKDDRCRSFLNEFGNRVYAIATSYDMLIVDEDLQRIDMAVYMRVLTENIHQSFGYGSESGIDIRREVDVMLPLKEAVYVGLIANEIITNAYKYAFDEGKGRLSIQFTKKDGLFYLMIEDDGKGFEPDSHKGSLGLKLIESLVSSQLQGSMKIMAQGKTRYEIAFTLEQHAPQI